MYIPVSRPAADGDGQYLSKKMDKSCPWRATSSSFLHISAVRAIFRTYCLPLICNSCSLAAILYWLNWSDICSFVVSAKVRPIFRAKIQAVFVLPLLSQSGPYLEVLRFASRYVLELEFVVAFQRQTTPSGG